MTLFTVKIGKSLDTEDPHRQKEDYAHVTHVKDGQRVRGKQHRGSGDFTCEEWGDAVCSILVDFAAKECTENETPEKWLEDRSLRCPDSDDCVTRRTVRAWLQEYGPTAMALGIHLSGS